MSYSIDANLLIYACNENAPEHKSAKQFLEACAAEMDLLCLTWPALFAFVRISTHPSIFENPLTPQTAWSNVEKLLALPRSLVISESEGFPEIYRQATAGIVVKGNLVPDAHIAALLLQHGVSRMYTADSDFRKFSFLEVINPLR
ncbi:MAG: PIN domain-containing protein [Verrucomicrobia bacterium]|nr:PIN domain-containing protein [Verrucomicrobiota bacterium]MCH8526215.1 PIN domain-containing protein [Kiritimatiellia bacterium]